MSGSVLMHVSVFSSVLSVPDLDMNETALPGSPPPELSAVLNKQAVLVEVMRGRDVFHRLASVEPYSLPAEFDARLSAARQAEAALGRQVKLWGDNARSAFMAYAPSGGSTEEPLTRIFDHDRFSIWRRAEDFVRLVESGNKNYLEIRGQIAQKNTEFLKDVADLVARLSTHIRSDGDKGDMKIYNAAIARGILEIKLKWQQTGGVGDLKMLGLTAADIAKLEVEFSCKFKDGMMDISTIDKIGDSFVKLVLKNDKVLHTGNKDEHKRSAERALVRLIEFGKGPGFASLKFATPAEVTNFLEDYFWWEEGHVFKQADVTSWRTVFDGYEQQISTQVNLAAQRYNAASQKFEALYSTVMQALQKMYEAADKFMQFR
ncbi:hypothetical protein NUH87_30890 [Pseudomonas batumici]|uniref:hypothetical protein n=1 Tax=Pseudomonas batumici TaxID=226910 RepID=UPI0030D3953E